MNVIVISLDTLRADHLKCYGYRRNTSPAIERIAREGVLFENFFATAIPTDPAFTTFLTGMDAYGHQVVGVGGPHPLAESIRTLPEILRAKGYYTAAVDNLGRWFARGFERYVQYTRRLDHKHREERNAEMVNELARPLLSELRKRQPFFLHLHYWDPHTPYWPPAPFKRKYYCGNPRNAKDLSMGELYAFEAFSDMYKHWFGPEVTDIRYAIDQYDSEIAYNSCHLSKLFGWLNREDLYEDSLIVLFSDHGEIMDEHPGQFDHHGLYEGNLRVPFLMRFPRAKHAGRRISATCQMADAAPTILDVLNVPRPRQMTGKSAMPLIRGRKREMYRELYLGESTWQCKRGIRTAEWKFIRALGTDVVHNWHSGPQRELYNLRIDPLEHTNLVNLKPRTTLMLEARLDRWLARQKKKYGHPDPIAGQGPTLWKTRIAQILARERTNSV